MNEEMLEHIKNIVNIFSLYSDLVFRYIIVLIVVHYFSTICKDSPNVVFLTYIITIFGFIFVLKSKSFENLFNKKWLKQENN